MMIGKACKDNDKQLMRYYSGPSYGQFHFPWYQLQSTMVRKYVKENSQSKQFIGFKLCAIMNSVMESHAVLQCPAWDTNNPFV